MAAIVLIPTRLAATRLPDKPLADIGGVPMIVRVMRQAAQAQIGPVVVAAGDQRIVEVVHSYGGRAVLTDPMLASGSDRVQAALEAIDPGGEFDQAINLQGDIPFFDPAMLHGCAALLNQRSECDIATAVVAEAAVEDRSNPDMPKAIIAWTKDRREGRALYFTRSTLYGDEPVYRHVGLYGYRRAALKAFTAAPPSPLERRENLEQLRALELGLSIWALTLDQTPVEVNTPDELEAARAYEMLQPKKSQPHV